MQFFMSTLNYCINIWCSYVTCKSNFSYSSWACFITRLKWHWPGCSSIRSCPTRPLIICVREEGASAVPCLHKGKEYNYMLTAKQFINLHKSVHCRIFHRLHTISVCPFVKQASGEMCFMNLLKESSQCCCISTHTGELPVLAAGHL